MAIEILQDIPTEKLVYTLAAGIFVFGLLDYAKKYNKVKHLPGPLALPFVGNLLMKNISKAPWTFTKDMRKKYGSVFCVWFGPTPWVILSDYESVRFAFTQDKIFPKDETYSKYVGIAFGDGLITVRDREKHRKDKSLLLPYFTKKKVETLIPTFCANTKFTMNKFFGDKKLIEDIDLDHIMLRLTYRFIMKYIWDYEIEDAAPEEIQWHIDAFCRGNQSVIMMAIFRMPTNTTINPYAADVYNSFQKCLSLLETQLEKRKHITDPTKKHDDVIQGLLDSGMSHDGIAYHCCTLLGAGHDTTAYWIGMSILMLSKNPLCQQKCLEEATAFFEQYPDGIPTEGGDIIPQFRYTLACMKETMRLKPIVSATTRTSARESVVPNNSGKKSKVPKDMNVMLALYLMQRDYDEPSKFKPERFMGDEQGFATPGFFPFAYGPRTCIGKVLTIVESILVVAHMVKEFEFLEVPGYKPKNNLYGISTTVSNGIRVTLSRRE